MDLEAFRKKIRDYCHPTGYSQKMLARALGLQPTALSNKLNGTGETSLKHGEIKQIVKILAEWEAITNRAEAIELLELGGLKESSISPQEWESPPLSLLEKTPLRTMRQVARTFQTGEGLHNFPAQPNPLVGRDKEAQEVAGLLGQPEVRLLTLTGSGGVGKTRLAQRVAEMLVDAFEGGVFFIPLAPVTNPAFLLPAIASSLGVLETGNTPLLAGLVNYFQGKTSLLVLDNFEQIQEARISVKELLEKVPGLKCLVTSRSLLHLYGESEYNVPPLSLPGTTFSEPESLPPAKLEQFTAVKLFIQRARSAKPDFRLTSENAPAVVEICRRLDGLPLALELAAARSRLLSPQAILSRLDRRLELLNRGPKDLPVRQQTLRALYDWSYELLQREQQKILARLAVFVVGCELNGAQAVVNYDNALPDNLALLDVLNDLVDQSMLQIQEGEKEEPRFGMLETLREYALEKLRLGGEEEAVLTHFADYYLKLAEEAEVSSRSAEQKDWLDRLEKEHDNLRAVLSWALARNAIENDGENNSDLALALSSWLAWFWDVHGHLTEGRRWLESALAGSAASSRELRAKALNAAGNLARKQNDNEQATLFLEQSLALRRELGQKREISQTLNNLGVLAYHQGDFQRALRLYQESLDLKYELGDKRSIGLSLNNLGELYCDQGDYGKALSLFEEGLQMLREVGDTQNIAGILLSMGGAAIQQGDYGLASQVLRESLELLRKLGNKFHSAEALEKLAVVAAAQDKLEQSARLFGAAHALRLSINTPLSGVSLAQYEEDIHATRERLGSEKWSALWQEGTQLSLEQASDLALLEE